MTITYLFQCYYWICHRRLWRALIYKEGLRGSEDYVCWEGLLPFFKLYVYIKWRLCHRRLWRAPIDKEGWRGSKVSVCWEGLAICVMPCCKWHTYFFLLFASLLLGSWASFLSKYSTMHVWFIQQNIYLPERWVSLLLSCGVSRRVCALKCFILSFRWCIAWLSLAMMRKVCFGEVYVDTPFWA